jgi:hypothetical protein
MSPETARRPPRSVHRQRSNDGNVAAVAAGILRICEISVPPPAFRAD